MNAFTCTGAYAILILYGIKRTENRNMLPEPREGLAAISCSKSFCKEQYGMFMAMAAHELSDEDFEKLPSWREVKDWPGKIIAVCDYKARDGLNLVLEDGVYKSKPTPKQKWDEGYRFWWDLSNVRRLPEPIPCRGNVWMWQLPKSLAAKFPQRLTSCNYLRILQNAVERRKNQKLQSRSDQLCNYSDFRVDYFAMKE